MSDTVDAKVAVGGRGRQHECDWVHMTATPERGAGEISAIQAAGSLLPRLNGFERAFARGEYALWLGAGISRGRMPDVRELLVKVLEFLRSRVDLENPDCEFRKVIDHALALADVHDSDGIVVDLERRVDDWEGVDTLLRRLGRQYSTLLDYRIPGEPEDFLVWTAVDVSATYSDPAVGPDLEHFAVAALVIEGTIAGLISANWDGLIERAHSELLGGSTGGLSVLVDSDDFRAHNGQPAILKFHGCAICAFTDEQRYRSYLVGRRSQITAWPHDHEHVIVRKHMVQMASTKRTLMIGLSGQDTNIQDLFAESSADLAWPWPGDAPAVLFAEDAIGVDQQNILRVVYAADYSANGPEIETGSLVRAYAKPLLGALLATTLAEKLGQLAVVAAPQVEGAVDSAVMGLKLYFSRRMGTVGEARAVLTDLGRARMLFSSGVLPTPFGRYLPLTDKPIGQLEKDPLLMSTGLPAASLALAAVAAEAVDGNWSIETNPHDDQSKEPMLKILSGGRSAKVWFVANETSAVRLEMSGFIDAEDGECVVISSDEQLIGAQRSPSSSIGRTGRFGVRRVHMPDLLLDADDFAEIRQAVRGAVGL
ncbi:SIR2 family protein [Agromyces sp. NPDC058126]|uniref:SIR2 family protein n=1 Tax=Agromyces sp. NPDC058126 TaxID=3346350 RepID=UPI0036D9B0FF